MVSKRIQPLAAESRPFRWSADAVLLLLPQTQDSNEINAKIARQAGSAFEHKIFAGARVATLKVNLRWVVMPVSGDANVDIDYFVEGVTRP